MAGTGHPLWSDPVARPTPQRAFHRLGLGNWTGGRSGRSFFVFYYILTLRTVAFHALGYALLLWVHRDDPVALLAYLLVLISCLLDQPQHRFPQAEQDRSNAAAE